MNDAMLLARLAMLPVMGVRNGMPLREANRMINQLELHVLMTYLCMANGQEPPELHIVLLG